MRTVVQKKLEEIRSAGDIGSSLQAEVVVTASGDDYDALSSLEDDLRYLFLTSSLELVNNDAREFTAEVKKSTHKKCERCWHYRPDVGAALQHETICGRCISNLSGGGEQRRHV